MQKRRFFCGSTSNSILEYLETRKDTTKNKASSVFKTKKKEIFTLV